MFYCIQVFMHEGNKTQDCDKSAVKEQKKEGVGGGESERERERPTLREDEVTKEIHTNRESLFTSDQFVLLWDSTSRDILFSIHSDTKCSSSLLCLVLWAGILYHWRLFSLNTLCIGYPFSFLQLS